MTPRSRGFGTPVARRAGAARRAALVVGLLFLAGTASAQTEPRAGVIAEPQAPGEAGPPAADVPDASSPRSEQVQHLLAAARHLVALGRYEEAGRLIAEAQALLAEMPSLPPSTPEAPAEPAPPAPTTSLAVYVVSSGNETTDTAVVEALTDRGHEPALGVEINQFDGSQADLAEFDAFVLLNSYTWNSGDMPEAGQQALVEFVGSGGGLVTGEWLLWNMSSETTGLGQILPGECIGYNTAAETTYTRGAADTIIHNDVPESFDFPLGSVAGSEAFLKPREGAVIFYQSSNSEAAGVLGRDYEQGRVLSFSTLLTATELGNPDYARLFVNAVEWTAAGAE